MVTQVGVSSTITNCSRADIEITDDMMRLHAFKIEQAEAGSVSFAAGDAVPLAPIKEFAAKPYTAESRFLKLLSPSTTAMALSSRRRASFASSR
jgi:predicted RNA binding protein with dsRBD fold (UPF0201 family)